MPTPATIPEFLDVVRKSGLVAEPALATELDKLRHATPALANPEQLAQALVRDGLLSRFQARQLKLGRYKRFMVAGKYRLLELLGAGGMGAVYLCEHILMRRLVALKVLPQEKLADPSNLERFFREARAVAALNHPNIVRAYDIDQFDKMYFLVMEYVDGRSLQEMVALYGKLDPLRAANYIAQGAVGLHHANELSMVHRDIKPGNLLLDRTGTVKLLDMGLARFFNDKNDNLTAKYDDNCVLGTADYLAPEQAVTNVVDIRADIYGLGGTMYFMLTGLAPAPDGTIAQKLMFHQTKEPIPVTQYRSDVPAGLLAVMHKMMAKKPGDRYQTPAEVAEALAPWADKAAAVPPDTEMPDLCPLVLNLAGYSGERARAAGSVKPVAVPRPGARTVGGTAEEVALDSGRVALATNLGDRASGVTQRTAETLPLPPDRLKSAERYGNASDASINLVNPGGSSIKPTGRRAAVGAKLWPLYLLVGLLLVLAVGTLAYVIATRP